MFKILKRTSLEIRRVRWSSARKTWTTFFIATLTLVFFATLIGLFTWGMVSMFDSIKK